MWAVNVWGGSSTARDGNGGKQPQCVGENQFHIKNSSKNRMPTFFLRAPVFAGAQVKVIANMCVRACVR